MKTEVLNPVVEEQPTGHVAPDREYTTESRVRMKARARSNIRRTITPEQVCVLTFDRPDSSANVFDRATLEELDAHLDFITGKSPVKGVVIASAKPSIFIAGADLHALAALGDHALQPPSDELCNLVELGQHVFNRVAALPIPTVAAIHGACLGGGYELCLACDYRLASPDHSTKIGLPETQLGILPAWGGCTRLPRLIGLPKALEVILGGKTLPARRALRCGLVDEVVPRESLLDVAHARALTGQPAARSPLLWRRSDGRHFPVAQIFNLLYRRIVFGRTSLAARPAGMGAAAGRLQICDTAESNSALRGGRAYVAHPADSSVTRLKLLATNNALAAFGLAAFLRGRLWKQTRGHYPAVLKALEVVSRGVTRSVEESLAAEREVILELAQTEACHNLVRIFFLQERAKKLNVAADASRGTRDTWQQDEPRKFPLTRPAGTLSPSEGERAGVRGITALSRTAVKHGGESAGQWLRLAERGHRLVMEAASVSRCAVIGAGVMGSGIAQWLGARGVAVILRDVSVNQITNGMANIARLCREGVKRHVFTPLEARQGMDRIFPTAAEAPLQNVDLIIEAAVEKMDLKKDIFRRLAKLAGPDTILATNTSALSISEIASAATAPERVVGLHFFNPVHRMQLVEVITGRQTDPAVVQRAVRFVQQIGKLPVVVNDRPGFLVNRILMPYLMEAGRLFEAGARVGDIDEAMLDFGMPMGPLRLIDEVGVDVAQHVAETLADSFPERFLLPPLLKRMTEAGLLGRKSDHGFYFHGAKPPTVYAGLTMFQTGDAARAFGRDELQLRMVLLMVNEAARCLEEKVVASADDVDFAMIMGAGFAPFHGGPLRYADTVGPGRIVNAMNRLADTNGPHFEPCRLLQNKAANEKTFHPEKGGSP